MEIFVSYEAATRAGAAFLPVRSAWTNLERAGTNHALTPNPVLAAAAGQPDPRPTALRQIQAQAPAPAAAPATQMAAELPSVNGTRKQKNVHKTRIGVGGFGAMGPYPERERLA